MKIKTIALFIISIAIMSCSSTKVKKMKKFDRNTQPVAGPAPTVNLKNPQTFSLANGLKILVVENHKLPRVSVKLSINNTPLFEGEKAGVSSLLSKLLGTGTTHISKNDFNEKVDFLGADISYGSQGAKMNSLSKFFPEVFSLLADGALNPIFTDDEFQKQVNLLLESIKSEEKDVNAIASRVEQVLSYGRNHAYGEFISKKSVSQITLQDVQALYDTYYRPNNAYLVIVGDVEFNAVKELVTTNFGAWEKGVLPETTLPTVANVSQTEINFINMPNASQSVVQAMNTVSLKMSDADYHAVLVANHIFGGSFNSYLNMNLREKQGFTYGARSSLRPDQYISRFYAGAQVRNEVVGRTVIEIVKELKRIRTEKVSDEVLKNVKASYTGKFVMAVEKPKTVARYALNIEKNNLSSDFYITFLQKINAVTADDVLRVAQKYFSVENSRIVVVSKAIEALPELDKLEYPIFYFDKEGNKTSRPKMPIPIPKDVTVALVLDNYFNAIGGKEKLKAVTTIEIVENVRIQEMLLTTTKTHTVPNTITLDQAIAGQSVFKVVYDGATGYALQNGQRIAIPTDELAKIDATKGIFEEIYLAENNKLSLLEIVPINEKNTYKMEVVTGDETSYKFFDVASGLLVQEEEIITNPESQKKETITTTFSDYKTVNGILFPFRKETNSVGKQNEILTKSIVLK